MISSLPHPDKCTAARAFVRSKQTGKYCFILRDMIDTIPNPGEWVPPGGAIEPNERAIMCAERECLEEIGAAPAQLTFVGVAKVDVFFIDNRPGRVDTCACYIGEIDETLVWTNPGEGQALGWFTIEEYLTLPVARGFAMLIKEHRDSIR